MAIQRSQRPVEIVVRRLDPDRRIASGSRPDHEGATAIVDNFAVIGAGENHPIRLPPRPLIPLLLP